MSITHIFLGIYMSIYPIAIIINFYYYQNEKILQFLLIFARILLSFGLLSFFQSPVFLKIDILKKYNKHIIMFFMVIILVFSFLHLSTSLNPYITDRGIIVENIQSLWAKILMVIIPVLVAIFWSIGLFKLLPPNASRFFRTKIFLLGVGVSLSVFGNIIYIFSNQNTQSTLGIIVVILGFLLIATGVSMPDIRRFLLKS